MTTGDALRVSFDDGLLHLSMVRPQRLNAIDSAFSEELVAAVRKIGGDKTLRVVLIDAEGPAFCAGGDLSLFQRMINSGDVGPGRHLLSTFHSGLAELIRLDVPVVASVQGAAAGAGLSLVAACDLVVAVSTAKFTLNYTKVGLTLDGASTYFLSRILGLRRATELALTNRVLSAAEALDWGLVNTVVEPDDLLAATDELVGGLRSAATGAMRSTKKLLREGWSESLETQMEDEARVMLARFSTEDAKEGIAAFLERRPPAFRAD
jgi:2-(1,2-epoxy-1,2-dihydrophenyl)acetyl-CoA isomerase